MSSLTPLSVFVLILGVVYANRWAFVDNDAAAPFSSWQNQALSYDRYYDNVDVKETLADRRLKRGVVVKSTVTVFVKRELAEKDRVHMVLNPPTLDWQQYTIQRVLQLSKKEKEPHRVPFFSDSFHKSFDNTATAVREVAFDDSNVMWSLYCAVSYFVTGSDKHQTAVKNAVLLWLSAEHMTLEDEELNALLNNRHKVYAALSYVFGTTVYVLDSSKANAKSPPIWLIHLKDDTGDDSRRQSSVGAPTMVFHYCAAHRHTAIVDVLTAPPQRQFPPPADWLTPGAFKEGVVKSSMIDAFEIIEQSFAAPSGVSVDYFLRPPTINWQSEICKRHGLHYIADQKQPAGLIINANASAILPRVYFHSNAAPRITTIDVNHDGNCGFESLSMFLSGRKENHSSVRQILLDEIYKNYADYLLQSNEERDDYMKKMRPLGKWMSTREMRAAAIVFKAHVFALCVEPTNVFWLYFSPKRHIDQGVEPRPEPTKDTLPTIALLLHNDHFMPILDVSEAQTGIPFLPPPSFMQQQHKKPRSTSLLRALRYLGWERRKEGDDRTSEKECETEKTNNRPTQ